MCCAQGCSHIFDYRTYARSCSVRLQNICAQQCAQYTHTYIYVSLQNICEKLFCSITEHIRTTMCATHVTEKTFFERLYLVLELRKIAPRVNCPYAPTTPTIHCTTISRFLCNFFSRMAPQLFWSAQFTK